ncbi:MAG: hypothetical protein IH858_08740 [Chloroflexi bacterium]|nr:hypothetical protein [Chloroflexota bacterium]
MKQANNCLVLLDKINASRGKRILDWLGIEWQAVKVTEDAIAHLKPIRWMEDPKLATS